MDLVKHHPIIQLFLHVVLAIMDTTYQMEVVYKLYQYKIIVAVDLFQMDISHVVHV
jgi:hypothetical protein